MTTPAPEPPDIRVLVVDDQAMIRTALGALIAQEPGLLLVGTADNGVDAVRKVRELGPDVVLMDVRMPVLDGIEATGMITADAELRGARVLILTTFEDDADLVLRAARSGASGFIGKAAEPEDLADALRRIHRGEALLSPRATRHLLDRHRATPAATRLHADLAVLTDRELDVLRLVAEGRTNGEIADLLAISATTVKTHVNRAMTKLDRHDRAQLVVLAYETGLVIPRYR